MTTAVEFIVEEIEKSIRSNKIEIGLILEKAKEIEKEQAELYAKFAVLNYRSGNPFIPFNEFINIDNI